MKKLSLPLLLFLLVTFIGCLEYLNATMSDKELVSGEVQQGYRTVTVPAETNNIEFTVYRGDYLKFIAEEKRVKPAIVIPDLSIRQNLSPIDGVTPFIKMKRVGSFAFQLGESSGTITVIEYDEPQYTALSIQETADLIKNISPLILDVRTLPEYKQGHLENSILVPVQQLQHRLSELSAYKDDHILIYCATGNRSTVAAKILIDSGFTRIYNMRDGIHLWTKEKMGVVQ